MSDVVIEQLEEKCVLAVSHRGAYNTIGGAFARLDAIARPAGLMGSTPPEMVAIYYDDPESTPASELRAHAGIVVPKDTGAPSPLEHVTIPAGRYAKAIHRGPYASLGDAWARLMGGVVVQSGEQLGSGPMYERYVNTPMDAAPADLVTELYVSLAERAEP